MGGTDFGYYFVRYMYEIISKHSDCKGNLKEPLVSGAALGLEGQLTVYNYKGGPCYRCLFPAPPPMTACQRCADSGVLGVLE